ncbi:unnamed protein product [Tetraodon nigroviridis]|uniref:(spotted green pufferfish) hypothetical protein n=1 Tax=Tetraodon nigroviridis TaxID=99883 RepID=Q4S878_TETNG|nr:unnamed protein product [Tetraodon nigroviridis]
MAALTDELTDKDQLLLERLKSCVDPKPPKGTAARPGRLELTREVSRKSADGRFIVSLNAWPVGGRAARLQRFNPSVSQRVRTVADGLLKADRPEHLSKLQQTLTIVFSRLLCVGLKVRRISPGSWINCPREVFHLCETETVLSALTLGKQLSATQGMTT